MTVKKTLRKLMEAFEPPGALEPIEVRNAILDRIEELVQPLGDGRRGLVHNRIEVRLSAPDETRRSLLEAALSAEDGLAGAIARKLAGAGASVPPDLAVEIVAGAEPLPSGREFEVVARIEKGKQAVRAAASPTERPRARLVPLDPTTGAPDAEIDRDVFNIGRVQEVRDSAHKPARRNQLYFGEAAATVSRQHAHIRYYPESGEFRIFDDRSARGTRLFSDGRAVDVPPGRGRGEQLHSGDEVYFGSIGFRFVIE